MPALNPEQYQPHDQIAAIYDDFRDRGVSNDDAGAISRVTVWGKPMLASD